jgi:hypothetical protein
LQRCWPRWRHAHSLIVSYDVLGAATRPWPATRLQQCACLVEFYPESTGSNRRMISMTACSGNAHMAVSMPGASRKRQHQVPSSQRSIQLMTSRGVSLAAHPVLFTLKNHWCCKRTLQIHIVLIHRNHRLKEVSTPSSASKDTPVHVQTNLVS